MTKKYTRSLHITSMAGTWLSVVEGFVKVRDDMHISMENSQQFGSAYV